MTVPFDSWEGFKDSDYLLTTQAGTSKEATFKNAKEGSMNNAIWKEKILPNP